MSRRFCSRGRQHKGRQRHTSLTQRSSLPFWGTSCSSWPRSLQGAVGWECGRQDQQPCSQRCLWIWRGAAAAWSSQS
jgi:hypothetical protein